MGDNHDFLIVFEQRLIQRQYLDQGGKPQLAGLGDDIPCVEIIEEIALRLVWTEGNRKPQILVGIERGFVITGQNIVTLGRDLVELAGIDAPSP
jgi:hypothetical protein